MTTWRRSARRSVQYQRAFTLPEMQVTVLILSIVFGGVLVTYLFGARLYANIQPMLEATDDARLLAGTITEAVKSATQIKIGNGGLGSFHEMASNTPQL